MSLLKNTFLLEQPQESRNAVALDIRFDPMGMNILGINGFLQHVYQVCRLKVGSGSLMAPVCSSFVFVRLVFVVIWGRLTFIVESTKEL